MPLAPPQDPLLIKERKKVGLMHLPFLCYSSHDIPCPFDYAAGLNAKRLQFPFLFEKRKLLKCEK